MQITVEGLKIRPENHGKKREKNGFGRNVKRANLAIDPLTY
jgi:hypothetical protein